jgi:hypothetical protein
MNNVILEVVDKVWGKTNVVYSINEDRGRSQLVAYREKSAMLVLRTSLQLKVESSFDLSGLA